MTILLYKAEGERAEVISLLNVVAKSIWVSRGVLGNRVSKATDRVRWISYQGRDVMIRSAQALYKAGRNRECMGVVL